MEKQSIFYIITQEPRRIFDHKGKLIGYSPKMAIFYNLVLGPSRVYRRPMEGQNTGLKILAYKTEKSAMAVCEYTNKVHNDHYVVEKVIINNEKP